MNTVMVVRGKPGIKKNNTQGSKQKFYNRTRAKKSSADHFGWQYAHKWLLG